MIDKLTKEQEKLIETYKENYFNISISTEPLNKEEVTKAINDLYAYQKKDAPEIIYVNDPWEGQKLAAQHAKGSVDVTLEEIRDQASKASFGSFEAQWVSLYKYIADVLPVQKDELVDIIDRVVKHCGIYWTFNEAVIMSPKPKHISIHDNKLHNTEGPAIDYGSGLSVYAVNGELKENLVEVALANKFETKQKE